MVLTFVADGAKYQSQLKDQSRLYGTLKYIAKYFNRVERDYQPFTDYIAQIDLEIKNL